MTDIDATRGARSRTLISALVLVGALGMPALLATGPATAATPSASDFDPGNIISDAVFHDSRSMSEADIQIFIDSKEPYCSAGYTCLESYHQATPSVPADAYCDGYEGGASHAASRIIYAVARSCDINPQVLLVTLQKETSLVASTEPSASRYKYAMGYACPDDGSCDSQFGGFFYQVYYAARQFQRYEAQADYFRYKAGRVNTVLYNPSPGCGSSQVVIRNQATANLYNYTPYQPNAAALANLRGLGDGCSAYGNRNFWVYFTDWFGSPVIKTGTPALVTALYTDVLKRSPSGAEVSGWSRLLSGGMPTAEVTSSFLTSDEYRLRKAGNAYRSVLGRDPENGAEYGWLALMRSGQIVTEDIDKSFLASEEYFLRSGGTNETLVAAMFQQLLGRAATPDEIGGWARETASVGRGAVVARIWGSVEAAQRRVSRIYDEYLGRTPPPDETYGWALYSLSRGDAPLRASITNSPEYFARAGVRFPGASA